MNNRHLELAILAKVCRQLDKRSIVYYADERWGYRIIAVTTLKMPPFISLVCSSFDKAIDIQLLRKNGEPDKRFQEKRFFTPIGAANYIQRKFYQGVVVNGNKG